MHQKGEQFREAIRKQQIERMFQKKRKQVLALREVSSKNIAEIQSQIMQKEGNLSLQTLKVIAKACQDKQIIRTFEKSNVMGVLPKFLQKNYLNTQEQYFATLALCNIFYDSELGQKILSKDFLFSLFETSRNINEEKRKTLGNCLRIMSHIVVDGDINTIFFLIDNKDIEVINFFEVIFKSQPEISLIEEMLPSIYLLIKKSKSQKIQKFKKLKKFLIKLFQVLGENQVLYLTILCFYEYLLYVPEEGNLSKTGLVKIFGKLALGMDNEKNVRRLIKIIAYSVYTMEFQEVSQVLLPFFNDLFKKYPNHQPIHTIIYKILFDLFKRDRESQEFFIKNYDTMLNLMIKELENSTSDQLIIELCYIFSLILYNYPEYLETEKGQIIFHKINEIQAKVNSQKTSVYLKNMIDMIQKNR